MQNYKYSYHTLNEIINNLTLLKDFSILEHIVLVSITIFLVLIVYYILPILYIHEKYSNKLKEAKKRKMMLRQIVLRKEIEDSILKEDEE